LLEAAWPFFGDLRSTRDWDSARLCCWTGERMIPMVGAGRLPRCNEVDRLPTDPVGDKFMVEDRCWLPCVGDGVETYWMGGSPRFSWGNSNSSATVVGCFGLVKTG
jgi:hypothetical protein